ncbi:hypothetical protein [Mucilaginibacter dorajii]|nr:hypothetical protein [Mucilaginibacter dorajii]MCS3732317.1 hypothetical protein [Mucilaginibacter dorajii]
MKIQQLFKTALVATVFGVSYFGFTITNQVQKVAGEKVNVSLISLSSTAQAYCNEAGKGDHNNGLCTGHFEDPTTRCLEPLDPSKSECKL